MPELDDLTDWARTLPRMNFVNRPGAVAPPNPVAPVASQNYWRPIPAPAASVQQPVPAPVQQPARPFVPTPPPAPPSGPRAWPAEAAANTGPTAGFNMGEMLAAMGEAQATGGQPGRTLVPMTDVSAGYTAPGVVQGTARGQTARPVQGPGDLAAVPQWRGTPSDVTGPATSVKMTSTTAPGGAPGVAIDHGDDAGTVTVHGLNGSQTVMRGGQVVAMNDAARIGYLIDSLKGKGIPRREIGGVINQVLGQWGPGAMAGVASTRQQTGMRQSAEAMVSAQEDADTRVWMAQQGLKDLQNLTTTQAQDYARLIDSFRKRRMELLAPAATAGIAPLEQSGQTE